MTRADCPMCDPCSPELDEEGRRYACYFCGDTGYVDAAVSEAYWREREDTDQRFLPRHHASCWHAMRYDEEGEPCGPRAAPLFSGLMPAQRRARPMPPADDDIPF
jgi:hypothetical protein